MALIWITGFSGAGKTTITKCLQEELQTKRIVSILLDGDELRKVLGLNKEYAYEQRREIAYKYAKLSRLISDQGIVVIVATTSMFEEIIQWNIQNNENYIEVYLKTSKKRERKA